MAIEVTKKTIPLKGISISIKDVRRIVERLLPHVEEEGDREVASLLQNDPANTVKKRVQIDAIRTDAFRIAVTITGKDGETLFGYGTELFDSPNIPEPIESIYISNNAAYYNVFRRNPLNSFILNLDFLKPPLIDNSNPVSAQTPNFSTLTVEGIRGSWVASIKQAVMDILEKKSNKRAFIHAASIYDIGVLILGLPVAIYLCWRFASIIENELGTLSPFLAAAAYVYIVFMILNAFKILFGYTKWAFPIVELTNNESRSEVHRKAWYGIILSIIAGILSDLIF